MPKKILITGASGFLGYHLLRVAHQAGYTVYGIANKWVIQFEHSTNLNVDLSNYIAMGDVLDQLEPDIVIHAAALADSSLCQANPSLSYTMNVEMAENIAGICSDYLIPMVFTSTDLVFDGKRGNYKEDDTTNPIMVYGEHKALAEQKVLNIHPKALVARCPLMFGDLAASDRNYFYNFVKTLKEGKTANLFTDEYRSIASAYDIASGIIHLCERVTGIIHIAGQSRISRYDFGVLVADSFGFDKGLLNATTQATMAAPRPADVSLNIDKALSLGYKPLSYTEALEKLL